MHLDDRLRSLKELIDEKSEMAGHLFALPWLLPLGQSIEGLAAALAAA